MERGLMLLSDKPLDYQGLTILVVGGLRYLKTVLNTKITSQFI